MIYGADSSVFVRAFNGIRDEGTILLRAALRANAVRLPPVVVTELLSAPPPTNEARRFVVTIPQLLILDGYWERAGILRADAKARNPDAKVRVADALVAQSCIDNDVPLITYDRDFRHFTAAGLKLA